MAGVDDLLQSVGRHRRRVRESETLLINPCGEASYLRLERSRRTSEYIIPLTLSGNHLTQFCEAPGWDILLRLAEAVKALEKRLKVLCARLGTVERQLQFSLDTVNESIVHPPRALV
jgi:hypothetical protein